MGELMIERRLRLSLVVNGVEIDEDSLRLLALVNATGSILKASKMLGMAYSRAWERIARIERVLGIKIVEAKRGGRGGGGAKLTPVGMEIVTRFLEEYRRVFGSNPLAEGRDSRGVEVMIYAGSNDPVLETLLGILRREYACEVHWIGSMRGLASIVLGEAWVAGIHLFDEETGTYNIPYIRKLRVEDRVTLKTLFKRVQGFITRESMDYDDIVEGLLSGRLRLVNRCWGSGTRILLDSVLRKEAIERGLDPKLIPTIVKGYEREVSTHIEVARLVASGEADVGMGIEWAARIYGLNFVEVKKELFELVIRNDVVHEPPVRKLMELINSEVPKIISKFPGYEIAS